MPLPAAVSGVCSAFLGHVDSGPWFDGFHVVAADLARPPADCPDVPCSYEGAFIPAGRADVNLVSWHELAGHAITVRGPALSGVGTDDAALRAFTRDNLLSFWAPSTAQVAALPGPTVPAQAAWTVLGVSRLCHLLVTGSMTSKSGAGRWALEAFGPEWHRVVCEALRARESPETRSLYADDRDGLRPDIVAFAEMVIAAGLAAASSGSASSGSAS
jgi:hypothetical protein